MIQLKSSSKHMRRSIRVIHLPHDTRLMDDGTSNKRQMKTPVRLHPYRGSNALCEPSSASHEPCYNQSLQILSFRNKDPEHEDTGCNDQHPSSLSTLTSEKLTKAKSSNASPQNQQDLPRASPNKRKPSMVLITSTSEMSCLSG